MFFQAFTFGEFQGSCLNTRQSEPAKVNAMKQTCVIILTDSNQSYIENTRAKTLKYHLSYTPFLLSKWRHH